jgi:curli biogenesis system outer membrane secretion channel CsgG
MRLFRNSVWFAFPAVLLMLACSMGPKVTVQVQKPAAVTLPNVKEIAVVDFQGPMGGGNQVSSLVQSLLVVSDYFTLTERNKLQAILDEQKLSMAGIVSDSTATEVGALLGVDALIFGEVTHWNVEPDERGTETVEKKEGTGKYEVKEEKNIFTGKTRKVKREIMRTVWVEEHYRIRRGSVAINFRVVDVESGKLLVAHSDSKSYDSGKVKEGSWKSLKPEGEILSDLSKTICERFVHTIAPYTVSEKRVIESGKGSIKLGAKFAQSGLWREALDTWKKSAEENPDEPAAFYNLGVGYEVQGMLDEAEQAYQTAVKLKPKKYYMDSIARIRQAREDQRKLQEQLKEKGK